jgi:LAS superfamily LD-carboxypeptidase LdcB
VVSVIKRLLAITFLALIIFLEFIHPAQAYPISNGAPDWTKVSFDNMGVVEASATGILDDTSLINQIGYNPSRSYSEGDFLSTIIKVGDLDILTRDNHKIKDFLGGADPKKVSLGEFSAINGASINDLIKSVPGLDNALVQSVPLVKGIIQGDPSQITSRSLSIAAGLAPEVKGFLKKNPWAADLPIEQLIQGDWQGTISKGIELGLPSLIKEVPGLKQVPLGDLFGSAASGDYKGLLTTGAGTLINKFGKNIPALGKIPVVDILGDALDGDWRGLVGTGVNVTVAQLAKEFPALANAPIGSLVNINNFSIDSVPNLASIALATPWVKNQIIKNVPGLTNVPLDSLLSLFKAATAKVDVVDQGAGIATRAMTGGGSSFASTNCAGGACGNFEVNQAKALIGPADRLNGLQFVVGSLDNKKGQSVKGGVGILGKMFGGKEPVHIRPWGDDANVAMAALAVNDVKGIVQLGFYLRVCVKPLFLPKTCTPYAIGPIPFMSVHEGETVVIQSTSPPPISAPSLGGYSDCGAATSPQQQTKYGHKPFSEVNKEELSPVTTGGEAAGRSESLQKDAASSFEKMRADAQSQGINLYAISGFRSTEEQTALWNDQVRKQGSEEKAARINAPPGYSEHHTGYAIDVGTSTKTDLDPSFESTNAYKWIAQNGKRYGFEQSFTGAAGQGAGEEAWHYRYVGNSSSQLIFNPVASPIANSSSGGSTQSNIQKYLARISWGESSGGANIGPNSIGAYGEYQFIPSTRDEILRRYGYDAWSSNKSERDQAVIALAKDVGGQKVLNAISSGDFTYADQVLNRTWTSLPGGAESNWTPQSLARYGGVAGSSGSTLIASSASCGGVACPPGKVCKLHHPLPGGVITDVFGYSPWRGRNHDGIDLDRNGSPDPIFAIADGTVVATPDYFARSGNYGYRTEISHSVPGAPAASTYNHQSSRNVQPGTKVARGQQIGREGNTSGGMAYHLHFETCEGAGVRNGCHNPEKYAYEPALR